MITMCISISEFTQLTAAIKSVLLQPYDRKDFLVKIASEHIFLIVKYK